MRRREFLKAAAALPLAASIPAVPEAPMTATRIKAMIEAFSSDAAALRPNGPWFCILHPQQERDLRDLAARERWRLAHRDWRTDGKPPMSTRAILDKYRPIHAWDVDVTEVGSYESIRFVTSERV